MGYNAVAGPNTYGSGCMPGMTRMAQWFRATFDAGSLGCYNPASLGGKSLHAEGRAEDIALLATDPAQCARGDAIFDLVMNNPDAFGAQEMLWRGYLWSYQNRHLGKRGPGIQQSDHMNHVHLGIDVNAGKNWTVDWIAGLEIGDEMTKDDWNKLGQWMQDQTAIVLDYIDATNKEERIRLRKTLDKKFAEQDEA